MAVWSWCLLKADEWSGWLIYSDEMGLRSGTTRVS